jgi:hypothetical protein
MELQDGPDVLPCINGSCAGLLSVVANLLAQIIRLEALHGGKFSVYGLNGPRGRNDTAATYASSGSTLSGLDQGAGTTEGDGEAGTTTPPSKLHVCSREYPPRINSVLVHFHLIVARCSDMPLYLHRSRTSAL